MKLKEMANNDFYVLEYMKSIEVIHGNEKIIIHTQQEIADALHMSKLKINQIIHHLFHLNLIRHYTNKGKYQITDMGYRVIKLMNTNIKNGGE